MDKDLNFDDFDEELSENDLSFNDYSFDDISNSINEISSGLRFELPENPLVEDISASSKLLGIFKKRCIEIENLLENTRVSKLERRDLQLELQMIKTAFIQREKKL